MFRRSGHSRAAKTNEKLAETDLLGRDDLGISAASIQLDEP